MGLSTFGGAAQWTKAGVLAIFPTLFGAMEACIVSVAGWAVVLGMFRTIRLSDPSVKASRFWPEFVRL